MNKNQLVRSGYYLLSLTIILTTVQIKPMLKTKFENYDESKIVFESIYFIPSEKLLKEISHLKFTNQFSQKIFAKRSALLITPKANDYQCFLPILKSFKYTHNIIYCDLNTTSEVRSKIKNVFEKANMFSRKNDKPTLIIFDNIDQSIRYDLAYDKITYRNEEFASKTLSEIFHGHSGEPHISVICTASDHELFNDKNLNHFFGYVLTKEKIQLWEIIEFIEKKAIDITINATVSCAVFAALLAIIKSRRNSKKPVIKENLSFHILAKDNVFEPLQESCVIEC
jgi:hypothetical protein